VATKCPKCNSENPETSRFCAECGTQLGTIKETPPLSETLEKPVKTIVPGTVFTGRYEILEKIGEGGMGEVYRALDKNLGRSVAIKILPEAFAEDKERLARFEREAKLLAVLNHPNIAAIYGLEETEGRRFLVLEMAEGETLKTRLDRGPLDIDEALELCGQVAEGLEAAHEKGIIHRDLKPGNIMITAEGKVKILDFGLAKAYMAESSAIDIATSPTITAQMTEPGVILGTAGYMSPEQARGRSADKRADIWAFGCILFECLTGKRAFPGDTVSDTLAQILKGEPDWNSLPKDTPVTIRALLRRCLQKDTKNRLHDIADARIEMAEARLVPVEDIAGARRFPLGLILATGTICTILGLLIGYIVKSRSRGSPPPSLVATIIKLKTGHSLDGMRREIDFNWPSRTAMAISGDASFVVYCAVDDKAESSAKSQLFMRRLDRLNSEPISGTEGGINPFLSPDDRWIGFWTEGSLKKIPIGGGVPQDLCKGTGFLFGACWADNNMIIYSGGEASGLSRISASGGKPEDLTKNDPNVGEYSHRLPSPLPQGKGILFTIMRTYRDIEPQVAVLDYATHKWRVLIENASDACYVHTGHLIFLRQGTLMAVAFNLDKLDIVGYPVPIESDVMQILNSSHSYYNSSAGQYSLSDSGSLLYAPGGIIPDRRNSLVWVDQNGAEKSIGSLSGDLFAPRLSPDGQKIAYATLGTKRQIWIYDIDRDIANNLVSDGYSGFPMWTLDGKGIIFDWQSLGPTNIYREPADRSAEKEQITTGQNNQRAGSLSPNGESLAFAEGDSQNFDIFVYSFRDKNVAEFKATPHIETYPEFSPDGHWLAYCSDVSGRSEVYAYSLSGAGGEWKISHQGGREPLWSRNGRQLFYRSPDLDQMWVVDVQPKSGSFFGKPRLLFEKSRLLGGSPIRGYDISLDDQRFLMVKTEEREPKPVTELILIQNWFEKLKRLVPPGK
jgi:serine/threonine protein kinase